jgi:aryl-alcohol dehydrogenase-like predicted oxidoreductase
MFTALIWRYLPGLVLNTPDGIQLMIGTAWHEYQPPTDKEKSFKLLDAFVAAGGNFFDTANAYSVSTLSFR